MANKIIHNNMDDFITQIQADGKLSFNLEDVKKRFSSSYKTAIKFSLNRLFRKGEVISVYKGFYVIVPPSYKHRKIIPPELFIDSLFKYIERPYYLGLLSAAVLHGSSHQQAMESYVFINKPSIRQTDVKGIRVNYVVKASMPEYGLEKRKTDTGYINISNPELTAIDLVQFQHRIGGLNRVSTVLYELSEAISVDKLNEVLQNRIPLSALQRLGYIFDCILHKEELSNVIRDYLSKEKIFRVWLKPDLKKSGFRVHPVWKIIENYKIESDF